MSRHELNEHIAASVCAHCGYVFTDHRYVPSLGIRFCPNAVWKSAELNVSLHTQLTLPFDGVQLEFDF